MTTFTANPSGDTVLASGAATTNYDTLDPLYLGESNVSSNAYRDLLKFDLSSIPTNAIVSSATLRLNMSANVWGAGGTTVQVYRQLRAWVSAQATWNIYSTGNNWATAGGFGAADCEQTGIGSLVQNTASGTGNQTWTLTASAVQAMFSGVFTNNGFLMKADSEIDMYGTYISNENGTPGNRPLLTIEYTLPVGGNIMWWF